MSRDDLLNAPEPPDVRRRLAKIRHHLAAIYEELGDLLRELEGDKTAHRLHCGCGERRTHCEELD